jgi:Domain of unknown function (DUF4386)
MANRKAEASPQVYARIGGLAYLIIIIAGAFGEMFIRNNTVVSGDAAATASNIAASPLLWRIGIAGDLTMHVCDLIVTMVYYVLLRPVNKNLALLAVLFGLIQTAVLVSNKLNLLVPLFLSENVEYLKAFEPHQLQALTYLSVKAHGYGFGIGLIFFGFECLIDGYLIFKSGYFPRISGVLIQIAGLCYLTNSFALILSPGLADLIFPAILAPAFIGELSMCLWLLVKGVNVPKWKEQAA